MNAVECRHLGVQLGDHLALSGVSFDLAEGDFLAVIGPNGAGKSTLMKALLGLVEPTTGAATVLGRAPGRVPAREVGYIPQIKTLDRRFPAMPIELVATGMDSRWPWRMSRAARAEATEAMRLAGIDHKADTPVSRLSGGELQRVYLARAFVREPRLLLLDEPATGMDRRGEADMYSLLEGYRARHRTTVVMITHDWEAARHHATHVVLLAGDMIAFGPPAKVLTEENMRRAFGHVGHHHSMTIPIEASQHHDHAGHHHHG
jgi:zinc transport system ATP-binding protein